MKMVEDIARDIETRGILAAVIDIAAFTAAVAAVLFLGAALYGTGWF